MGARAILPPQTSEHGRENHRDRWYDNSEDQGLHEDSQGETGILIGMRELTLCKDGVRRV